MKDGNKTVSSDSYTYCERHEPINYFSESSEFKGDYQSSEEPYYNRMVKKSVPSKPVKNQYLAKENWNSLYSDVEFNPNQKLYRSSLRHTIKLEDTPHNNNTIDNCSIRNNLSLNTNNLRPTSAVVRL